MTQTSVPQGTPISYRLNLFIPYIYEAGQEVSLGQIFGDIGVVLFEGFGVVNITFLVGNIEIVRVSFMINYRPNRR